MNQDYKVHHEQIGPMQVPRIPVCDSLGRFWMGDEWNNRWDGAWLFDIEAEAEQMASTIVLFEEPRRFGTKLAVEVNCNEPFDLAQLQECLSRRCYIYLDYDDVKQPLKKAAFALVADWDALEEE